VRIGGLVFEADWSIRTRGIDEGIKYEDWGSLSIDEEIVYINSSSNSSVIDANTIYASTAVIVITKAGRCFIKGRTYEVNISNPTHSYMKYETDWTLINTPDDVALQAMPTTPNFDELTQRSHCLNLVFIIYYKDKHNKRYIKYSSYNGLTGDIVYSEDGNIIDKTNENENNIIWEDRFIPTKKGGLEQAVGKVEITPPMIFIDLYVNNVFGCGLNTDNLDLTELALAHSYCLDNNFVVAPIYDKRIQFLDAIQELQNIHFGYLQLNDTFDAIQYRQFTPTIPDDTEIIDIDTEVIGEPEFTRNTEDFYNRIKVQYTKADDKYSTGVAVADDDYSFEKYGIKESKLDLQMITDVTVAQKIANTYLSINQKPEMKVSFKVGYSALPKVFVGNIVYLLDRTNELFLPLKITKITEEEDGASVEGVEFYFDGILDGIPASYIKTETPNLIAPALALDYAVICEFPSYIANGKILLGIAIDKPEHNTSWAGAIHQNLELSA
jgi:hypothetical protein